MTSQQNWFKCNYLFITITEKHLIWLMEPALLIIDLVTSLTGMTQVGRECSVNVHFNVLNFSIKAQNTFTEIIRKNCFIELMTTWLCRIPSPCKFCFRCWLPAEIYKRWLTTLVPVLYSIVVKTTKQSW